MAHSQRHLSCLWSRFFALPPLPHRATLAFKPRKEACMQLSEILTRDVETIRPDTSAREAAQRMRSMDVGALPVCDGRRLLGMVTDRDLTLRILAEGRDPNATPVQVAMTPDICYAFEDDDVQRAADIMKERQIRRLPIVNRDKQLVGI